MLRGRDGDDTFRGFMIMAQLANAKGVTRGYGYFEPFTVSQLI